MLRGLPREIRTQIAGYMADDLQAVDPRCYRASCALQAVWRGWFTRSQAYRCPSCGGRTSRVYQSRVVVWHQIPLECAACHARSMLYATGGAAEGMRYLDLLLR